MESIRISIIQTDIVWENKQENLRLLHEKLQSLRGITEIVVLPEMFTTGFSMNSRLLAEPVSGTTLRSLKNYAIEFHLSLAGSFICEEQGSYYNRAFLITPDGQEFYYDKRHLFRMGHEAEHFSAGSRKVIIPYNGWNICLQVCYDLRFPVWSRNVNNEYDLLIYVASWPTPRIQAWNTLLCARAIENQCYVCGVNRIGHSWQCDCSVFSRNLANFCNLCLCMICKIVHLIISKFIRNQQCLPSCNTLIGCFAGIIYC